MSEETETHSPEELGNIVDAPVVEEPEVVAEEEPKAEVEEPKAEVEEEPQAEVEEPKAEVEEPAPIQIPKQRLDAEIARRKQLEDQLAKLQEDKPELPAVEEPEKYDFDAKESEYQQAIYAGESDKASALRKETREAEMKQIRYEAQQYANASTTQAQQDAAFATTVSDLQTQYPIFDPTAEGYDKTLTELALNVRDRFIASGQNAASALSAAVELTLARHRPEILTPLTVVPPTTPAQVAKKVSAANRQPPTMPGDSSSSRGEAAIDINTLSQTEFDALPESTLQRLRGDMF
jgi:hypothetical protein